MNGKDAGEQWTSKKYAKKKHELMSSESREEKTWYTHALVLCVSLTSKSMGKKKKQN